MFRVPGWFWLVIGLTLIIVGLTSLFGELGCIPFLLGLIFLLLSGTILKIGRGRPLLRLSLQLPKSYRANLFGRGEPDSGADDFTLGH
jgi:hypothetical protein